MSSPKLSRMGLTPRRCASLSDAARWTPRSARNSTAWSSYTKAFSHEGVMDLAQKVTSMHRLGAETRELYQVRDGSWEARVFCRANDDNRVGAGATPADALDH